MDNRSNIWRGVDTIKPRFIELSDRVWAMPEVCYTEARSPALVEWPDLRLEIAFDEPLGCVVVHSRATSFCVEPQTAWPNPIALEAAGVSGTGLAILDAGDRLAASMTWTWRST